jgi:hypothetical protein
VQLKNDLQSQIILNDTIPSYYKIHGERDARNFLSVEDKDGAYYTHYLVNREHVFRYSIGNDRGSWLGALELAIGPHYFNPAAFWSYENFRRFSIDATTEAVEINLTLLDEFWGYEWPRPWGKTA